MTLLPHAQNIETRLTNIETLQNQILVSALNRGKSIRVEKNFIWKILVDDIVFEFKNFLYIEAFFNNIVSSAEIKVTSEVTKNVLVYVPIHLLEIFKLKKVKSKVLRKAT